MKQSYLILRRKSNTARAAPTIQGTHMVLPSSEDLASITIDVEELDSAQLERERKKSEHVSIVELMPLRLIKPTSVSSRIVKAEPPWGITAIGASQSPYDGEGVTVAILDTGIDRSHPAFNGMQLIRKNFTSDSKEDENGHGTHCAGTFFGRAVDEYRIGVAPGIKRALIAKVISNAESDTATLMQAIQWAANEGAAVISMSLGIDFPGFQAKLVEDGFPPQLATSYALRAYRNNIRLFDGLADMLVRAAPFGQASILVAASGNESRSDKSPDFKIHANPPGISHGVVCVGAVEQCGDRLVRADFSNIEVTLVAPGVDIVSAKAGGGLVSMSGTSMATPHVAGTAALLMQKLRKRGHCSTEALYSSLLGSASYKPLAAESLEEDVGLGLVQIPHKVI